MAEAETFQHYEVLKNPDGTFCELGRGAMGVTYKAFDTSLRSLVALKVINAAYLDSDVARERFKREARAAAGLRHPNVGGVFHLGEEGGNYFYAMEFIDGETLEAFVRRRGPLPPALALNLTLQVARALRAAAKVGLVHRDIKPANLMLSREDEDDADEEIHVRVIDFGLAKVSRAEGADASAASLTGSAILGTPHYISPEQLEEKPLDARSDIYSLGVTLWFMLTGKPPYSGSLMQVMTKHLTEPPPFDKIQDQPAAVRDLLHHLLEKDPANRPQTPLDLRHEIEAALKSLGAPAVPPPAGAGESAALPVVAAGGVDDSTAPPAALPAKLPIKGLPLEKVAGATLPVDGAPPHVATRELPSRRNPATPPPPPPPARSAPGSGTDRPARAPLFAGVGLLVLLLVAGGAFAFWKMRSRPAPDSRLAVQTPPPSIQRSSVQTPPPVRLPSAAPSVAAGTPPPADAAGTSTAPSPEARALADAKQAADSGHPVDALAAYLRVQDQFPDSAPARAGVDAAITALRATQELPANIRLPLAPAEEARFAQARANVERAADAGSDSAMVYLGDHLIRSDPAAAIDWFHKAALHGEPEAMHQLGNMYRLGLGTGLESADYAHWFQEASDAGYPRAKVWLAECYIEGKGGVKPDRERAFRLLNEAYAAEPNNAALLEKLGDAYARGYGTPVDGAKAFSFMQQAADLGWASAYSNLGSYYMNGVGTEKNPVKGAACYKRGAELNDLPCMYFYALCLEKGTGLTADAPGAVAMMEQAANGGFVRAMGYLGTYYKNGFGMAKPDLGNAIVWYRQGVEKQDPLCEYRYAQCLEEGAGVKADKELAAKFYADAANKGYPPAMEWVNAHKAAAKPAK